MMKAKASLFRGVAIFFLLINTSCRALIRGAARGANTWSAQNPEAALPFFGYVLLGLGMLISGVVLFFVYVGVHMILEKRKPGDHCPPWEKRPVKKIPEGFDSWDNYYRDNYENKNKRHRAGANSVRDGLITGTFTGLIGAFIFLINIGEKGSLIGSLIYGYIIGFLAGFLLIITVGGVIRNIRRRYFNRKSRKE